METPSVKLATNKRYFIEDKFLALDCVYDQTKMKPLLKDWIGLYPYGNIKLYEPLIFEYVMDHPTINGNRFKMRFIPQLFAKFIHCSGKYQFVYVDSYFKIIATSDPIEFMHKNDCICNNTLKKTINNTIHVKMGQDVNTIIQRLKYLEERLLEYEKNKKEAMQLNEQLVNKLKVCEMLRSRGEQFIDNLYNALDQGKPVKLINSKGHTRWIKRMQTNEIRNHVLSTKTVRNDVYLTAIINSQEKELQRLKTTNNELNHKLTNYNELLMHISEPGIQSEVACSNTTTQMKSNPSTVVKFVDESDENSDDYCE